MERLTDQKLNLHDLSVGKRWLLTVFLPGVIAFGIGIGICAICVGNADKVTAGTAVLCAACVGAGVCIVFLLLERRFRKDVMTPLDALSETAKRISEGSYGIRTEKKYGDEIGDLTDSLNEISERIAAEDAVQTEFISSVSHELRTPLTAVTGWAEALAYDEAIQGDSRRGLEIISRESARLTKMVGELLEFTRIQDGRFHLSFEQVDIVAETEDALLAYSKLMQQEDLELRFECAEDIPVIEGDSERLKQVLLNLLDNAAKYGKDGGSIDVSVLSDEKYVTITVRDHGRGIPAAELPHVKERFYKGSGKERGSGIGLAVCEEIVTRHGGMLTIENAPEGGVVATAALPLKQ